MEYNAEREAGFNYIIHNLKKFSNPQLDYFARRVQTENYNNDHVVKLGVNQDRKTCGNYILNNMHKLTNYQLKTLVGEMMARVEDNEMWHLYDRENWQEAW